jgi:hypothetical protein
LLLHLFSFFINTKQQRRKEMPRSGGYYNISSRAQTTPWGSAGCLTAQGAWAGTHVLDPAIQARIDQQLAEQQRQAILEFAAKLRPYGYGYFVNCADKDELLEHHEWCVSSSRQDASYPNPPSLFERNYWRAFKSKEDAALFLLTFDAQNLMPEISFQDEENW